MHRSIATTTAALVATAGLATAPAALARPAIDPSAPGPHLTASQLRAIDGHQPPDPAPYTSGGDVALTAAPGSSGSGDGVPWVLVFAPIGLLAAGGAARFTVRHHGHHGHRRVAV